MNNLRSLHLSLWFEELESRQPTCASKATNHKEERENSDKQTSHTEEPETVQTGIHLGFICVIRK